jgi:uncharacterized membrane protein
MEIILFFVGIAVLIGWARMSSRFARLEETLQWETSSRESTSELIAGLTRRVSVLEKAAETPAIAVKEPLFVPQPAVIVIKPPVEPKPIVAEPAVEPKVEPAPKPKLEPPPFQPTPAPEPARDKWSDQLRQNMGGQEWEALIGGNWLNKVGVFVLVIGIALLLGYEFTRTGPSGRVAIGLAVSLTMLVGGVLFERRLDYAVFGRGLIGGGWAALYFTTYAMHGIEAARVIDNPYLASSLLLAVAAGMILHSLRYQSQAASGLAYFIAFSTLAMSENTPFSVMALIPLAGSLLFLAYRFNWHTMAVFGLLATYSTAASRPDTGASLSSTQALFGAYWLLLKLLICFAFGGGSADCK